MHSYGHIACAIVGALLLATGLGTPGASAADSTDEAEEPAPLTRLAGTNRIDTALEVSRAHFDASTEAAFLATARDFPDALAAGPVAARLDAPILLTAAAMLPDAVEGELARLDPDVVYVLGGPAAIDPDVVADVTAAGFDVKRLAGDSRVDTANAVAQLGYPDAGIPVAYVASGRDFPDALGGGAAGALREGPVLLTEPDELTAATLAELERLAPHEVVLLGGHRAVAEPVEAALAETFGAAAVSRLAGGDRYETSGGIAHTTFNPESVDTVFVATGHAFPDALAGAPAAGRLGAPVLLMRRDSVPAVVADEIERLEPQRIVVLGGPSAISFTGMAALADLLDVASPDEAEIGGATTLSAGMYHSCAVEPARGVVCWGGSPSGEIGTGTTSFDPESDVFGVTDVPGMEDGVDVAAADSYTCGRHADGHVSCWGWGPYGVFGTGDGIDRFDYYELAPASVVDVTDAVELTGFERHACVRHPEGTVSCWGAGKDPWGEPEADGALGDGAAKHRATPVAVQGLSDARALATGGYHTCAAQEPGTVSCWGGNYAGQLGDGTREQRLTPTAVRDLDGVVGVSAGQAHTCALHRDGGISCWGLGWSGQRGDGSSGPGSVSTEPGRVPDISDAVALAVGRAHTCAVHWDGGVSCWGSDDHGELGIGTDHETPVTTPVRVPGIDDAVDITAGQGHTCARHEGGAVSCWGRNDYGQLGDDSTEDRTSPVRVDGL